MTARREGFVSVCLALGAAWFAAACSSSPATSANDAGAASVVPAASAPAVAAVATAPAAAVGSAAASAAPPPFFREEDFVESEQGRDPFRSFSTLFADQAKAHVKSQRQVLLDRYGVDELKLVALVTNIEDPRAMLVDPTGKGWIVTRGQFVGKAEIVHAGGPNGDDYALNWRVDRIRDGDVVLVRDDPTHVGAVAATRVLALHTETDEKP